MDRFRPNLILGLSSKVETVISGCYATFIGSNRSLVRSPLAGYLGGSVARYVKVKEAEKPLMSAQSSSFEVRRRGAPSSARIGGGQGRTAACACRAASFHGAGMLGQLSWRLRIHSAATGGAIPGLQLRSRRRRCERRSAARSAKGATGPMQRPDMGSINAAGVLGGRVCTRCGGLCAGGRLGRTC